MVTITKRNNRLTNFDEDVGQAYKVSKNGVLTVDIQDENFQAEFIKQLKLLKSKREEKLKKIQDKCN